MSHRRNARKGSAVPFILVLVAIVGGSVWYFRSQTVSDPNLDAFARCLASQAILYESEDCPACTSQRRVFGNSEKNLRTYMCNMETLDCLRIGIDRLPTWVFESGEPLTGITSLRTLAERSGCVLAGR